MANCPKCGKLLKDEDKKCPGCGGSLTKIEAPKSKKNFWIKIVIIAVVAAVIAGVAISFAVKGGKSGEAGVNPDLNLDVIEIPVIEHSHGEIEESEEDRLDIVTLLPKKNYTEDDYKVDIEINDDNFIEQIITLRQNLAGDYLGETVSIEGAYAQYAPEDKNVVYHNITRGAISKSGDSDKPIYGYGMEFVWDGEIPKEGDWIKVVGVLRGYEEKNGGRYLTLDVLNLEVTETPEFPYVYID